jgi:hypothetical protein
MQQFLVTTGVTNFLLKKSSKEPDGRDDKYDEYFLISILFKCFGYEWNRYFTFWVYFLLLIPCKPA